MFATRELFLANPLGRDMPSVKMFALVRVDIIEGSYGHLKFQVSMKIQLYFKR